jgi:hypothetical protein
MIKENKKNLKNKILLLISILGLVLFSYISLALPTAPIITHIENSTSGNAGQGQIRSGDDGGYITTLTLDALQQNFRWKAYVGNVSGRYILEDSNGYSIYEWDMSLNTEGKVFISRNGTVDWTNISCANRTSTILSEDSDLGMGSGSDSINKTFNDNKHKTFNVAGVPITNSTCPAIATYVNDTSQTFSETAVFQEILLADAAGNGNLIYTTIMEEDVQGYDNSSSFDFQAIIADDETAGIKTPYYFYVELGI